MKVNQEPSLEDENTDKEESPTTHRLNVPELYVEPGPSISGYSKRAADPYYITIREKTRIELIDEMSDDYLLLSLRKAFLRVRYGLSHFCYILISSSIFEFFIFVIIIANTIFLATEDPRSELNSSYELFFMYAYSVEAFLKIAGLGLIMSKSAYLRSYWNWLDSVIIIAGWVSLLEEEGINLSALRALRVLRPLRNINSIPGLKALMGAIIGSLKSLIISLLMLILYLGLFAIAGVQLLSGLFKNRCLHINTGVYLNQMCGEHGCPPGYKCASSLDNPNYGFTNFDSVPYAFLAVFQCITLEGWSSILYSSSMAFSDFAALFMVPLVFVGAFLLLNFMLAAIKSSFSRNMDEITQRKKRGSEEDLSSTKFRNLPMIEPSDESLKNDNNNHWGVTNNKRNLLSVLDQEERNVVIRMRRGTILDFQTDLNQFKYTIPEVMIISSDSIADVIPFEIDSIEELKIYQVDNTSPEQLHLFEKYNESTSFALFARLSMIHSCEVAFAMVFPSTMNKGTWSGPDVNLFEFIEFDKLSQMSFRLWSPGLLGKLQRLRFPVTVFANHRAFSIMVTISVILNTMILSLNESGVDKDLLYSISFVFSYLFLLEFLIKIIGLGPMKYFRDPMNYVDSAVLVISIVDYTILLRASAFTALRILRILKVVGVARLFRYLNSLASLLSVLGAAIYNVAYMAGLLFLFAVVFALIGMQLFGGQFIDSPRTNFDTFHSAFITVFQILSLEDWQSVFFEALRSRAGSWSMLYFVAWIFLGNFVLLNLILAVLLDSFDQEDLPGKQNKRQKLKLAELEGFDDSDDEGLERLRQIKTIEFKKSALLEVPCDKSFFIFTRTCWIRRICYNISVHVWFERGVLALIVTSSVKLVIETYYMEEPSDSPVSVALWIMDIVIIVGFFLEFLMHSISRGFVGDPESYLRESWSILDFIILVLSAVQLGISNVDLAFIKVFRLFRTLRPLRFISHNPSIKMVVTALIESILSLINVIVLLLVIWLMFAILGVSLFAGTFNHCENQHICAREECESYGLEWVNIRPNFDNTLEALLTVFILSSLENWPEIMRNAVDGRSKDECPSQDHNPAAAYYFIFLMFIVSFFCSNLFIGVVFMHFNRAKRQETAVFSSVLNSEQRKWIEMQPLIIKAKPQIEIKKAPNKGIRGFCYFISKHPAFEVIILSCILLNLLQMAMIYEGAPSLYMETLDAINLTFTIIFTLECMVKITGLGIKHYLSNNWNRFDFAVICASFVELMLQFDFWLNPKIIRVFRMLRISRVIRIFKILKPLQDLILIMRYSVKAILNVLSLISLIFFVYAILGVFLFYSVELDDFYNFDGFFEATLVLFRVSTGEDWPYFMFECGKEVNFAVSVVYFVSFVSIATFVMLNMFIMVIVNTYEDYENDPQNSLQIFNVDSKRFKRVWADFATSGIKIHYKKLPELMYSMPDQLGVESEVPYNRVIKILTAMNLFIDVDGFVYFNDMLYAVLKRKHDVRSYRYDESTTRVVLRREDAKTLKQLEIRRKKFMKQSLRRLRTPDNCFMTLMYAKRVFKAWKYYVQQKSKKGIMNS